MADRQPYLNTNFYGAAVPPSTKAHRSRRILCTILKVAISFIVGVGILLLILGFVYSPTKLEFNVSSAELTQFNFTINRNFSTNANMRVGNPLSYKLGLNVTIRNPNKRYRVYYDINQMDVVYKNQRLETQWLPAFAQETKSTVVLNSRKFEGQQLVLLGGHEFAEFNAEKSSGIYPIDVKFFFRLRMKSGTVVLKLNPTVYCGLKVPLINGKSRRPGVMRIHAATACDFKF